VLTLLSQSEGASIEEMMQATDWQQHWHAKPYLISQAFRSPGAGQAICMPPIPPYPSDRGRPLREERAYFLAKPLRRAKRGGAPAPERRIRRTDRPRLGAAPLLGW
jgi:hypothetical protein